VKLSRQLVTRMLGLYASGDLGPWTFYTSRRHAIVAFLRAPPKTPATYLQLRQRNRWRAAAEAWSLADSPTRQRWRDASRLANLRITPYNLWVWYQTTHDSAALSTIENQTGIELDPWT
jgi:hypothetical protein